MTQFDNYQKVAEPYLQQICEACHATSAWLAKHDFKRRVATVVAQYVADVANSTEKVGDIGEEYPEGIDSQVWRWLRSDNPQSLTFHTEDIPADELERFEYLEDDVKSVLCYVLREDNSIWGFVEVWDSRKKHDWTPEEIAAGQAIIPQLEAAIRTNDEL